MSVRNWLEPMREVCTLHSGRIAIHGNSIIASGGSTPTMVAVPRMARLSMAWRTSFGVADGLERVIDAGAAGERADGLDRIVLGAVDDVGGADALGHLQLAVEHVDADDLAGAADARALHDRQPDAAAAEHRDGLARPAGRSVRSAAPTPVRTPQPTSAARSSGRSGSIFTSEFSCSSMRSA